ncbi:DUF1778 domain-containing protein [Lautropia dentalis]|uniref:DUF1778 domain-containing protein n=1 Tax=Lautropia dentalis TaxID=2490857 RepID=A0A426FS73_9BURK|nr:DUF1778 domain-containing protein [Lautropia dentalis]RRN45498.1 DUF1778 domain-containing protein [Lautropia dentalis]
MHDIAPGNIVTTVTGDSIVTLSAKESQRFLEALDASFQPNAHLKQAMGAAASIPQPFTAAGTPPPADLPPAGCRSGDPTVPACPRHIA